MEAENHGEPVQVASDYEKEIDSLTWADAVNLAYNARAASGKLTEKGVRLLAEMVLKADKEGWRKGHMRYEIVRRMNVRQLRDAWQLNISTGKPFDQIIDELAPFCGISQEK